MNTPMFEIGVVYRKNSRLYLAVSERNLITFRNGKIVDFHQNTDSAAVGALMRN